MGAARQRKLDARARRQESLHNQGVVITAKKNEIIKAPQPAILQKKEVVKVNKKIEPIIEKRGRGRTPKSVTATTKKKATGSKKLTSSKKEKK